MKPCILTAIAIVGALIIVSTVPFLEEHRAPLPDHTKVDSIIVEKSIHRMTLFKDGELLRTYRVALGRGGPEPKSRQGDARTPEGSYFIDRRNPHSCCHLAPHISYPSAADGAAARARGGKPGSDIAIHGLRNGMGCPGRWHT